MRFYVGNTDLSWFQFLRANGISDEANFWRPNSQNKNFRVLSPGELFFFRLKNPISKIAGYGVFRSYALLPLVTAWDFFGEKNGASDPEQLIDLIGALRHGDKARAGNWLIGCTILSDIVFYPESDWLPLANKPGSIPGSSYDTSEPEGTRIWQHMQAVSAQVPQLQPATKEPWLLPEDAVIRTQVSVKARPQQGVFRTDVLQAYGWRCSITGERTVPVIDAAHIHPYVNRSSNDVRNGLALRKDIHRLFDLGFVGVDEDRRFVVSPQLERDWHNGREYYALDGKPIRLPSDPSLAPSVDAIRWHWERIFQN